jgi:uncharacterized damage-inducible protein DinB
MRVSVGLELDNEGRVLAWALDFPGCFAYGADSTEAAIGLAREMTIYDRWIQRHSGSSPLESSDFDFRIVDTWQVFTMNDQYELQEGAYAVNAWFRSDWKPLGRQEIEHGLELLRWSRKDLLQTVSLLSVEQLDRQYEGERWSIHGILKHVASAEWWYLDRLDLVEGREQMPKDVLERFTWVREKFNAVLPQLSGKELVLGKEGEFWSPRKLLRRALWHELDHRQHILKLLILQ